MSTNIAKPIAEQFDVTLDRRIDETRRLVRQVDISLSLLSLLTIVFGAAVIAVLADHWLFAGGLSMPLRIAVFFGLFALIGFYIYRRIVPLFLYPINPAYAANLLEESTPSLKNSIINWLLLRQERLERGEREGQLSVADKLAERMFDGVARTAASNVNAIPTERAVDLRGVTYWGIALMLLFLFFIVYAVFSPKNPLTSLARIMLPISGIERPQAVQFRNIEPGNTVALQGEKLTVSVELTGRSAGNEPVYLFFSTDDGQAVRQAIPMALPEGKARYEAPFPPGKQGFSTGTEYWIAQGDSRSGTFRIDVHPTASIEVVSLKYQYPAYTGLPEETVENNGDIRAVEGTDVKISARSSIPVQRVDLVLDNDPTKTVGMRVFGDNSTEASATISLKLNLQSTTPTTIRNYSFRATDSEGYESRRSGIFRLEVLPDKPPIIQWADTDAKLKDVAELDLPLNGSMEFPIQAEDLDFGLRYLRFYVESGNKRIRPVELLESPATGPTEHKGAINKKTVFSPISSRLAEGDTAEIWAEAVDTKFPDPNIATTRRITVRVTAPQKQEPPKENEKNPDEKKPEEQKIDENNPDENNSPDRKEGEKQDKNENQGENEKKNDEQKDDQTAEEQGEKPGENNSRDREGVDDKENGSKQEGKQGKDSQKQENSSEKPSNQNENSSGNENSSNEKKNGNENDSKQDDSGNEKSNPGENGSESDGNQKKPINPDTQDGDAMEEIIKQMKKDGKLDDKNQEAGKPDAATKSDSEQNSGQESGSEKQNGEESKSGGSKPDDSKPDDSLAERSGEDRANDNGKEPSPGQKPEENAKPDGGDQQGDPNSEPAKRPEDKQSNQNPDGEKQDAPVDPTDQAPRQRDDSLDPNSKERRNQGSDPSDPKKSDVDDQQSRDHTEANKTEATQKRKDGGECHGQCKPGECEHCDSAKAGNKPSSKDGQSGKPGEGQSEQSDQQGEPGEKPSEQSGEQGQQGKPGENQNGQPGKPSEKQSEQQGNQPGKPGENQSGQPGQPNQSPSNSGEANDGSKDDSKQPSGGSNGTSTMNIETLPEDANLEYTKKITNLVLEYLEDQLKEKPSQELLDNLGWTEKELRDFHRKWKEMSDQSKRPEAEPLDDEKWKEAFKSLGLKPAQDRQQLQKSRTDKDENNAAESQRFAPPPAVKERFKRYTEGIGIGTSEKQPRP